jgi:chemotaxis response regulator CheB
MFVGELKTSMKVFIANSAPLSDEKLDELLSELEGVEVVGQSQDVGAALQSICELKPDVVLLDIDQLGDDGRNVLKSVTGSTESPFLMMRAERVAGLYPKQTEGTNSDFLLHATAPGKALAMIEGLLLHLQSRQKGSKA